ncbi:MAG: hypothetical protein HRF50_10155 [Phycisphaerae bacterium]
MKNSPRLDGQSLAIGVLSVTACVLFVGLLIVTSLPKPALAIGQSDQSGDFKMLTQQISNSVEALVVIDAASKQMNYYWLDYSRKQLQLVQPNVPLDRLPGGGAAPEGRQAPP